MQAGNLKNLAALLTNYELPAALFLVLIALARPQWGVVALGLLALLWLVRWFATGRLTVRTALDWGLAGLILTLPLALWVSVDRSASLVAIARLLVCLALFYAIANNAVFGWQFHLVVGLIIAAGVVLALLSVLGAGHSGSQTFGLPQQIVQLGLPIRAHTNVLATGMVVALPMAAALVLSRPQEGSPAWLRPLAAAVVLLILLALVLGQSRGAYLGVLAAAATMLAMRWRWARWAVLTALALAALALVLAGDRIAALLLAGASGREAVWLRGLLAVQDLPVTGIGFGLFERVVPVLYPFFDLGVGPLAQATHAHNLFLQVAVDTGVLGLVSFLATLLAAGGLIAWLWRCDTSDRRLVWGLAGSLVGLLVHGLVDTAIWNTRVAPLLWVLLGLLVVLPQRMQWRLNRT